MILASILLSFAVQAAQPQDVPLQKTAQCDSTTMVKACAELERSAKDGIVQLSRGERLALRGVQANPQASTLKQEQYSDLIVQRQAEILAILEDTSKKVPMSDRFKMSFLSVALWTMQKRETGGLESQYDMPIRLPMPPGDPNATVLKLTKDEFEKVIATFPVGERARLKAVAQKFSDEAKTFSGLGFGGAVPARHPNPTVEQVKNAHRIFLEVKDSLIKSIQRGRRDGELSAAEKSLILRIQTVELKKPDGSSSCAGDLNAYYRSNSHSIMLCDSYYDQPESQLAFILGHEIGHSLDPCRAAGPLYANDKGDQFSDGKSSVELGGQRVFAVAIPSGKHPLEETKSCLIKRKQVRFLDKSDLTTIAEMDALYAKYDQLLSDNAYQDYRKQAVADLVGQGDCARNGYINTDINEAMSDVYGFVALEAQLRAKPPGSVLDATAAIPFITKMCDPSVNSDKTPALLRYAEPHQSNGMRAFLATQCPSLAKGLGCEQVPAMYCGNELLSYAAKMPTPATGLAPTPSGSAQTPASAK